MKSLETVDICRTAIKDFPCSNFLFMKNLQVLSFQRCKGVSSTLQSLLSRFRVAREEPVPLKLHSLSNLCSLTVLRLSYCNLGEGDIPSDLGCLSSLRILALSGNYFVNLPTSINKLSNFLRLYLNNCKKLKSLPKLPPSTTYVSVRDCTLLELSKRHRSFLPFRFDGMNSYKLVEKGGSNLAFAIMKRYFQSSAFLACSPKIYVESASVYLYKVEEKPSCLEVLLPGSGIPEWFSLQSEENSMALEKPTHSPSNVFLGYAMCCVFSAQNLQTPSFSGDRFDNNFLNLIVNDSFRRGLFPYRRLGEDVCDHIWLLFFPIKFLELHYLRDCSQTEVVFQSKSNGVLVKQCAIRKVYEQDVNEFHDMSKV